MTAITADPDTNTLAGAIEWLGADHVLYLLDAADEGQAPNLFARIMGAWHANLLETYGAYRTLEAELETHGVDVVRAAVTA